MHRRITLLLPAVLQVFAHPSAAQPIGFRSIGNFLTAQGFDQIRLQRRFGNHLYFSTLINGRPASLLIDSAAPTTLIHRESTGTYALVVGKGGDRHPDSVFAGSQPSSFDSARLASLQFGRQNLANVPVAVANQAAWIDPPEFMIIPKLKPNSRRVKLKYFNQIASVNGLLGSDLLQKYGAVMDCGHQMLYIRGAGTNTITSQRLAALLADRGFARVPMRITRDRQFEVDAAINGHRTRLIVDTGSSFTLIGTQIGYAAGVSAAPSRLVYVLGNYRLIQLRNGRARELTVGSFSLADADISMVDLANVVLRAEVPGEANSGLLGMENLSLNYAMIDFGSMTLYLRHPDRR